MGTDYTTLQQVLIYVLQNAFGPMQTVTQVLTIILGLGFIISGVHRLRHHGGGMTQKHHSPTATTFFFIAGASLVGFNQLILSAAQSVFDNVNNFDPNSGAATVTYYVNAIQSETDPVAMIKDFAFGMLVVVGVLSFIRGMMLLVKLGEGQAEGSLPRAITHIIAGIVGVDALGLYNVMQNFINGMPS